MSVAFKPMPASFDRSKLFFGETPPKLYVQKDGLKVAFQAKRVGSWRPKKSRNR